MKAIISISDLHVGSTTGLCPPSVITVDQGEYSPNKYQRTLIKYWRHFWREFVPEAVKGAKKVVLEINGDLMDGVHHNTVNILSNSWLIQEQAAMNLLDEISDLCPVHIDEIYVVKGTEVHAGPNGESEERIAQHIGAVPNEVGEYASYEWWLDVDGLLFQFSHHVGTTSSAAYESSAPMRELIAALVEAAQWDRKLPDVIVRSHRHRFITVPIPQEDKDIMIVVTPGWQLKTPHVWRNDRMRMPHIGGVVSCVEDRVCQIKRKLYRLPQPQPTKV